MNIFQTVDVLFRGLKHRKVWLRILFSLIFLNIIFSDLVDVEDFLNIIILQILPMADAEDVCRYLSHTIVSEKSSPDNFGY